MMPGERKKLRAAGRAMREARVAAGFTQARLAAQLNWPTGRISSIETGRRHIAVDELFRIARVLGVDPLHLLGRILE